jgi:hypothetical protein
MYRRPPGTAAGTPTVEGGMRTLTRTALLTTVAAALLVGASALPAAACGGLIAPNGTVRLLRTSTLAAWHDGIEHYVTSFSFAGDSQGEFGSIVPLPAVPTKVERGGGWTLQRLARETAPPVEGDAATALKASPAAPAPAEVLQQVRIDALDVTVLQGGGQAVGDWAREHGFLLTPDAPEVLDFYARRSPIFLAARFDAAAARARGQLSGDGTPVDITMPLANPWVPLRILGLGLGDNELVQADVYLLTDRVPSVLPGPDNGMRLEYSQSASPRLLDDLRADKGMEWVPTSAWLSLFRIDTPARQLHHDLAIDVSGRAKPSAQLAGFDLAADPVPVPPVAPLHDGPVWPGLVYAAVALTLVAAAVAGSARAYRRRNPQ